MDYQLTPQAQEIQDRYNNKKFCLTCDGAGVIPQQPYGLKTICFSCKGTGRKLIGSEILSNVEEMIK